MAALLLDLRKVLIFEKTSRGRVANFIKPIPILSPTFHAPLIASFLDTNDAPFIWQLHSGSHLFRLLIASPLISNFPSIYNFSSAMYYSKMHKLDETRGKGNKVRLFAAFRPSTYFIGRTLIFISIPTTCTAYFSMIYFFFIPLNRHSSIFYSNVYSEIQFLLLLFTLPSPPFFLLSPRCEQLSWYC